MNPLHRLAALAALLPALAAAADTAPPPAHDRLTVPAAHRPAPLAASVWAPAGGTTYRGRVGDNPVFIGAEVLMGAPVAPGRHPLVLLSHGSGGSTDAMAWLASDLAQRGAIALAVNHPGSTTGDSSPRRSTLLAERAADLSAALDALLADPAFGPHVDPDRIAALGFSLGGATALNLGGARIDPGAYADWCASAPQAQDCVFLARGGVDFAALPASFRGDAHDPRIGAVIAVDPGFVHAMEDASLSAMDLPVLLLNLGSGADLWPAVDAGPQGANLTARLPRAQRHVIAPAWHFSFLPLCRPGAPALLAAENDDPVCDDPAGADRAAVHARAADLIAAFLGL